MIDAIVAMIDPIGTAITIIAPIIELRVTRRSDVRERQSDVKIVKKRSDPMSGARNEPVGNEAAKMARMAPSFPSRSTSVISNVINITINAIIKTDSSAIRMPILTDLKR